MSLSWTDTQIGIQLMIVLQAFGTSFPGAILKEERSDIMNGWIGKQRPYEKAAS